ncbi:endonuclease [Aeromonas phage BUCT695]|uniref:endonuclease n=1 Tax=Aeromonas phage BUCT695 TaxID=2908630 RepID=UPI0023291196|nr:endonuclease [Aeromonas phage BUCT695]UIW10581.1 endonuclease [Aeromonas phage BUCT695]
MARRRYRPKKEDVLKGSGYDSMLEKNLHEGKLKDAEHHPKDKLVSYKVDHTYEPDFYFEREGKKYLIESKGRFQDSAEARKYTFVREFLPADTELVFVWQKPSTRFPFARKRKDGTYMTQEEWADKNEFRHWSQEQFELEKL